MRLTDLNRTTGVLRRTVSAALALAVGASTLVLGAEQSRAFPLPHDLEGGAPVVTVDHDDWHWRRRHVLRNDNGDSYAERYLGEPDDDDRRRIYRRYRYDDDDRRAWRRDDDRRDWRRHRRDRDRDDLAAGIAGLAAGALLGGIVGQQRGFAPSGGGVGVPPAGGYAPFSPGYMNYCSSKFRSFDPQSGTFLGYDGQRHYCR